MSGQGEAGPIAGSHSRSRAEAAEGQEAFGLREREPGPQLAGHGPQYPPPERCVHAAEPFDLDRNRRLAGRGADGTAAPPYRPAWQQQLRQKACDLALPVLLLVAGNGGELRQRLVQAGVFPAKQRQDGVAKAIAGKGRVGIRAIFAPGLPNCPEIGLDLGPAAIEQWPKDGTRLTCRTRDAHLGGDAAEALGPGSAQKLHQNRLGLIVEGVGGQNEVGFAGEDQPVKDAVAQTASCFFDGFASAGHLLADVGVLDVKRDTAGAAELLNESEVEVRFRPAQVVVDMYGRKPHSKRLTGSAVRGVECAEQGDRVRSARNCHADSAPDLEVLAVEGELGRWGWHGSFSLPAAEPGGPCPEERAVRGCLAGTPILYTPAVMQVYVILPAAGIGTRMAAGGAAGVAPKQFLEIAGVPVLVHAIRAFLAVPRVDAVCVAVRRAERARVESHLAAWKLGPRVNLVEGGEHRQQSVGNALAALECAEEDIVLVHDAVRPLVDPATIERTIDAIERHGAAIVGLPAVDTIKQVERTADGAIITATIPRERIVQAQTPQGALAGLLRRAFAEAEADGFAGTDEASLLERAGIEVAVVAGSPRNFKITQPGDLELAEFYLERAAAARPGMAEVAR